MTLVGNLWRFYQQAAVPMKAVYGVNAMRPGIRGRYSAGPPHDYWLRETLVAPTKCTLAAGQLQ